MPPPPRNRPHPPSAGRRRSARTGLLASLVVVVLGALTAVILGGRPDPALMRHPLVIEAMAPLALDRSSWQTVVILSSRDVDLPRAGLWSIFERLPGWPVWAQPLITEAHWVDAPGWRPGARFEQTLDLGFPFYRLPSSETVDQVDPGRRVAWRQEHSAFKAIQLWSFEDLPNGGTRVVTLELFHGPLAAAARGLIEQRMQRRFDSALDGLILAARRRS